MEVTLYSLHDIRWRDEVLSKRTGGTTWLNLHRGSTLWATTSFEAPGFPGTGTLSGTIRVDVFDPWRDIADWDKRGRLLGSFERRLRAEAEVVDPAVAVLEPDTNASKAGLIRSSIAVQHPEIRLGRAEASSHPTFHAGCAVHYVGQALPDLAFQAFLRPQGAAAGTEWPIGTLVSVASRNNIYQGSLESSPIAGLGEIQPGQQFEIVLRPSPDLAESLSTRIHRPWSGGEIILDGIVPEVVKAPR